MTVVQLQNRRLKAAAPDKERRRRRARHRLHQNLLPDRRGDARPSTAPPDSEEQSTCACWVLATRISRGVKAGAIIDVDEAERAIRLAVDAAERMAQRTISQVWVNVSGGRPQSSRYSAFGQDRRPAK